MLLRVHRFAPRWSAPASAQLADPDAPRGDGPVFALDVAPDHSTATIAVAWRADDGRAHVQLAAHDAGVEWVAARAGGLTSRWGGRLLVEQTGTGAFLLPALERAGADVDPVGRRTFVDACGGPDAAVAARTLGHGGQAELNNAVAVARWSSSGEAGQRVLSRRNPRVSPLVAVALALPGLEEGVTQGGWMVVL